MNESINLHTSYLTTLKLVGEKIIHIVNKKNINFDIYTIFMDIDNNVKFVDIYKDHFNIVFTDLSLYNNSIKTIIKEMINFNLTCEYLKDISSSSVYVFNFKGTQNSLLKALLHLEKLLKNKLY